MHGEWLRVPLMTRGQAWSWGWWRVPRPPSSPRLSRPGTREVRAARMALGPWSREDAWDWGLSVQPSVAALDAPPAQNGLSWAPRRAHHGAFLRGSMTVTLLCLGFSLPWAVGLSLRHSLWPENYYSQPKMVHWGVSISTSPDLELFKTVLLFQLETNACGFHRTGW